LSSIPDTQPLQVQAALAEHGGLAPTDPAYPGQAEYTPRFLAHVYDPLVLRFANRFVWRCPTHAITALYDEHVSDTHLDVGPGTGYFLERCAFPSGEPAITLLDVNPNVLEAASRRIARHAPRRYLANLLEPLDLEPGGFDSIALTHVLHCLPGTIAEKQVVLERLGALLRPGGRLFGTAVLGGGVKHTPLSRAFLSFLNGKGMFSNLADDASGLDSALATVFADYELTTRGAVALFVART
jgi:ubiquinone/menaquinone biosynthesis C-methylase UbiE